MTRALTLLSLLSALGCDVPATSACPNDLPATCPNPSPGFAHDVNPVIQARCAICHSPSGPNPDRLFPNYQAIHDQRGTILTQVYACRMPPPDGGTLTASERAALLGWLVCGAPDN